MTDTPADILSLYGGTPTQLAADLLSAGFTITRQGASDWLRGASVPGPAALPHLARLLAGRGVRAADLYRACGVPLPADLFPSLSAAGDSGGPLS